jgi:hypothetical protein
MSSLRSGITVFKILHFIPISAQPNSGFKVYIFSKHNFSQTQRVLTYDRLWIETADFRLAGSFLKKNLTVSRFENLPDYKCSVDPVNSACNPV